MGLIGERKGASPLECYTISAVDKSPKIWYNKSKKPERKEKRWHIIAKSLKKRR